MAVNGAILMLKQVNLPESATPVNPEDDHTKYEETEYVDACANWPCYLHKEKDDIFGFCQIDKRQIKHTLATCQRVCDYKTTRELQKECDKLPPPEKTKKELNKEITDLQKTTKSLVIGKQPKQAKITKPPRKHPKTKKTRKTTK